MPFCVICEQPVERWLPHPLRDHVGQFTRLIGAVGSNLDRYACPKCGCNDQERHLWLYLQRCGLAEAMHESRILHIAPEKSIELRIKATKPSQYVRGNPEPGHRDHVKVDMEHLPFDDGSFELIFCNHMLEQVRDPGRALQELCRCLTRDGHLVAQTLYAPGLKWTLEVSTAITPQFARLFYGADRHLRLFGADVLDRFYAAGLRGELPGHHDVLREINPIEYGINEYEPFFLFERD